jgi:hypothetical protein
MARMLRKEANQTGRNVGLPEDRSEEAPFVLRYRRGHRAAQDEWQMAELISLAAGF